MGVPQKRVSPRKRDMRRSHHALAAPMLVHCSHCKAWTTPHRVCVVCGRYKGREVVHVEGY